MKLYPEEGGQHEGHTWLIRCDECNRRLKKTYGLSIANTEFSVCRTCLTKLKKLLP